MKEEATDTARAVRAELFERFIEVSREMRHFLETNAMSLGLTPPQAHALHLFAHPRPMRSAAKALRCDASYITHIADDLESLGLAQRTSDPHDRRVKQVTLTAKGRELHGRLQELLYEANPLSANLEAAEQIELVAMLRTLPSPSTSD